ncbi:hypothetical protein K3556_03580 [Aliiroseovarius sp. M344]|uniref:hypothetical protein n=1 Tax=Aliiroseovarius sp. M344 TaxID=2867010 RepID=UPI0021AE009E|nr:hypothetical protein [Aliiroseovarius sp. M344]UWQ14988.1 hypothetical protein K3556_03580 [Aliiroseovarius sp. M344]
MATHTADIFVGHRSITARLMSGLSTFGQALIHASENSSHMKEVRRLNAQSDAELAKLGIERGEIPRYVFSGAFYI